MENLKEILTVSAYKDLSGTETIRVECITCNKKPEMYLFKKKEDSWIFDGRYIQTGRFNRKMYIQVLSQEEIQKENKSLALFVEEIKNHPKARMLFLF